MAQKGDATTLTWQKLIWTPTKLKIPFLSRNCSPLLFSRRNGLLVAGDGMVISFYHHYKGLDETNAEDYTCFCFCFFFGFLLSDKFRKTK